MRMNIATSSMELWRIENGFANDTHAHDEQVQVTIPIRGVCHFTQENRMYRLDAGNALVQHPREKHEFRLGADAGVIIFQVNADALADAGARPPDFPLRSYVEPDDIQSRFRQWTNDLLVRDPSDRLSVQETESHVAAYLTRLLRGSPERDTGEPARRPAAADPHLRRALDYIDVHYRSALSVDELAALALQSRFHFIRSFKAATGLSPYQYVLHRRIEEAKRKLRATRMSVTDISAHLGFSSTSQFYRAFRNAVGVTPEQYRK
ncbi:AraC family transcriptional regulator [Paenibacillus flagellatus]|uniref:AraC family transcriptional regulator n=1 Tax=Paenibacillus flagellatus TaxID=2211139 RepID=A0A2V5KUP0_9BACL|nr:AraC family transcriptional regulator [Paenibacillus flagellatus]PYI53126.1 AraC family transcriptional regulator [Paenibacillus flagellatus]